MFSDTTENDEMNFHYQHMNPSPRNSVILSKKLEFKFWAIKPENLLNV